MSYFEDYEPRDLLDMEVVIDANGSSGKIKGYAVYSNREDTALVSYVNDSGTVITDWFPISDLHLVESDDPEYE